MSKQKPSTPVVQAAPVVAVKRAPKVKSEPKVARGTARRLRREAGNYTPVNPAASLEQAPTARFARQGGRA